MCHGRKPAEDVANLSLFGMQKCPPGGAAEFTAIGVEGGVAKMTSAFRPSVLSITYVSITVGSRRKDDFVRN